MQRRKKPIQAWQIIEGILKVAADLVGGIAYAVIWMSEPPGSCLPLGAMILLTSLFNITGYYELFRDLPQLLIPGAENFQVNATSRVVLTAVAAIISIAVQAVQAKAIRDNLQKNKALHSQYSAHTVPERNDKALDIAEYYRRKFKRTGMRQKNLGSFGIFISYTADFITGYRQFPILAGFAISPITGLANFAWWFLHVFGTELFAVYFLDAWEEFKATQASSNGGLPGKGNPSAGMNQGAMPTGAGNGQGQKQGGGKGQSAPKPMMDEEEMLKRMMGLK